MSLLTHSRPAIASAAFLTLARCMQDGSLPSSHLLLPWSSRQIAGAFAPCVPAFLDLSKRLLRAGWSVVGPILPPHSISSIFLPLFLSFFVFDLCRCRPLDTHDGVSFCSPLVTYLLAFFSFQLFFLFYPFSLSFSFSFDIVLSVIPLSSLLSFSLVICLPALLFSIGFLQAVWC